MDKNSTRELLTIQKFICLLDDFHFGEFSGHLKSINATLPLKLTTTIRKKLPDFDSHEDLCKNVYGGLDKGQRQSFNQLSSYTFKLSYYLALNYPAYLLHNIPQIQKLVNAGNHAEANFLADILWDIAERVEDFQTTTLVLKFLSQQAFAIKDHVNGFKLNDRLEATMANEALYISLQTNVRIDTYRERPLPEAEFEERKRFYRQYHDHSSHRIKIMGQFGYLSCVYHNDSNFFTRPEDKEVIASLEKELRNNSYLLFPFMSDIAGNIGFMKLNSPFFDQGSKEATAYRKELKEHYGMVHFWKNYMNMGELMLIANSTTRLLTAYHCYIHRSDYFSILGEDKAVLAELVAKCRELLSRDYYEKNYEFGMRSVGMMLGALLIISGGENIIKGVNELESLLISYQQVNLKGSTDSVYLCLMVGYFSLKDYEKCVSTFKRYVKNSKGKPIFEANDAKIHSYYYLAQWLLSGSKQYPAKLHDLWHKASFAENGRPPKTIMELIDYFKVPVEF